MEQLMLFDEIRDFRCHRKYVDQVFKTKNEIQNELIEQGRNRIYRVLSFGGGTQSAHLLEQHLQGHIHYDMIIFSDTGAEPQFIHKQVDWWRSRQKAYGNTTPFIITHHSKMKGGLEEMLMRYIFTDYQRFQMPVHCATIDHKTGEVKAAGMMPRQCTIDFKILPVKQMARRFIMEEQGLMYRQKFPDDIGIIIDIGFSYDEIRRINTYRSPQFKYMYLAYPLVEENLTTEESIRFLEQRGFPTKRSRCYLCPFNCDDRNIGMDWDEIIENEPLSFLKACWFDDKLREVQQSGSKIMRTLPFLHYSRKPLKEVYLTQNDYLQTLFHGELDAWISGWEKRIMKEYRMPVVC